MVYKPLLPVFQLAQDYRAREIKNPKGRPLGRKDVQRLRDYLGTPSRLTLAVSSGQFGRLLLTGQGLLRRFLPRHVEAEPVGDARGEQSEAEDIVGASHARVAEEEVRHQQRAGQLEQHHHLPRRPAG